MSVRGAGGSQHPARTIRVIIADDHPLYRDGLSKAVAARAGFEVVAQTGDGAEALALIQTHRPDIALVDLRLPSMDGIAITEAVATRRLTTRVMIISAFEDSSTMYQAFDNGARAYLTKVASPEAVSDAIRSVAAGEIVFPESVRSGLNDAGRTRRARSASTGVLTAREREVIVLTSEGYSAPEVAEQLYLSVATVKTHLQHIYDKLGASDRAAAVAAAARRGLLN